MEWISQTFCPIRRHFDSVRSAHHGIYTALEPRWKKYKLDVARTRPPNMMSIVDNNNVHITIRLAAAFDNVINGAMCVFLTRHF